MIVYDPPAPPPGMTLVTTLPEHQAVEIAIRIARIDFLCAENVGAVDWLRILATHDTRADFLLMLPGRPPITVEAVNGEDPGDVDPRQHREVRGVEGVLHLAARLSALAAG